MKMNKVNDEYFRRGVTVTKISEGGQRPKAAERRKDRNDLQYM